MKIYNDKTQISPPTYLTYKDNICSKHTQEYAEKD